MNSNIFKWLVFSSILFLFASTKHFLLGNSVWDFGIFEQFSWLIANGKINDISSLRGIAPLQDHFSLLLLPIGVIYKLLPSGYTLIALQSLALGSLPILSNILFNKNRTSSKLTTSLYIAICFSPLIFLVNIANFHPEVVSVPFILLAIAEIKKKKSLLFVFNLIVILSAKKSQVLVGMGLAIYSFSKGKMKKGLISLVISYIWWIISSKSSAPGGDYITSRLGYLGDSISNIIVNIISKPWLILNEASPDEIILYTVGLLLPFIFLLGKNSTISLISLMPIYLTNIISSSGSQRELYSQYSISILPFVIVGCWESIESKTKFNLEIIKRIYYSTLLITFIAFIGYSRIGYFKYRYFPNLSEAIEFQKTIKSIRTKNSVLTTDKYASRLSNRKLIHSIETNRLDSLNKYDIILLPVNGGKNIEKINQIKKTAVEFGIECKENNKFFITCEK